MIVNSGGAHDDRQGTKSLSRSCGEMPLRLHHENMIERQTKKEVSVQGGTDAQKMVHQKAAGSTEDVDEDVR